MNLPPIRISVAASAGLVPKGEPTHPAGAMNRAAPLAGLARQHPSTRDSLGPLAADLPAAGVV